MNELLIVLAMAIVFALGYSYGHDAGKRAERLAYFAHKYLREHGEKL